MNPSRRPARAGALVAAAVAARCVTYDPTEQVGEALTVCHSVTVEGVDVSSYQGGSIDWNAVHASGREFAIARLGDGTYRDTTFARNWAGIRAAGMIRGAYIFFRPTVSVASQAALIAESVGRLGAGDLPLTIDVECMCPASAAPHCESSYAGCASPAAAASALRDLVARVTSDTGKAPMIYTGAWFWDGGTYLAGAVTLPSAPLWVSGYITGCVTVPRGWSDWRFWQYSNGTCSGCLNPGPVPGIGMSCDRNRFNGTLADLRAFAGATPDYGARFVAQSFPYAADGPLRIAAGGTATVSITLQNIGARAWDGSTCLGTSAPRDRASPLAGPEWRGPNRPACVSGTVAPGASYRFEWVMHAPSTAGRFDEHWGVVQEAVTWFSAQGGPPDEQLEGIFEVTAPPPPPPDAGAPDVVVADVVARDVAADAAERDRAEVSADDVADAGARDVVTLVDDVVDEAPTVVESPGGGCGCAVAGARSRWSCGSLALAALALRRRRRR